jgi:hypothetical protein
MNCEHCRTVIGAEPNSTNAEVLAHLEQCPECARYREEMQAMDRLIYRALAVDVAAPSSLSDIEAARSARAAAGRSRARVWRMAASLLISASLVAVMSVWLLTPRDSFASEVVEHVLGESQSLVRTSDWVDPNTLEQVLAASRLRLKPGTTHVSYAMSCQFRGQSVPHLVVQSEQGPVTVLVMTAAPTQRREAIDEGGFQGVVLPAPRGVIVVLGKDVPVDAVAGTLLRELEYLDAKGW